MSFEGYENQNKVINISPADGANEYVHVTEDIECQLVYPEDDIGIRVVYVRRPEHTQGKYLRDFNNIHHLNRRSVQDSDHGDKVFVPVYFHNNQERYTIVIRLLLS